MEQYTKDLVAHLSEFVTEQRLELFHRVLNDRTRYITVLLEDIYQSHNASAVMRTCDCTGIQDIHVVEERNEYDVNPDVALGSNQWLSIHYYNKGKENIDEAVVTLKQKGYRIVATTPHKEGITPETFDLKKGKAVLMFGTELNGLTDRALELADEHIQIPMIGFTESYNISVSAAITLYQLRGRLADSDLDWKLDEDEKIFILREWLSTSIKMSEQIEKKFEKDYRSLFKA